ncbi:MAG: diadenylate cyclase CdaA [Clostridia bacterium]|nr:diadenylate cyclase CdaA [Clostridia bacterium]
MQDFLQFFTNVFSGFSITDAVDIIIVTLVVYYLLKLVLETRAEQIIKGILVLVAATVVSDVLELHTLNWMCKGALALGAVAVLIVLQPELRRALEFMGRGRIVSGLGQGDKENSKRIVSAITNTVEKFSNEKTGALIVFERQTMLEDYAESGTVLNARITEQLLGNIFYEGAPLHDGAVIINGPNIYAAGCVLPLSRSQNISKDLGTRHRAGLGITENSDALVIIVSEETGIISMAEDGRLERFLDVKTVEKKLLDIYLNEHRTGGRLSKIRGARKLFGDMHQRNEIYNKSAKEDDKDASK